METAVLRLYLQIKRISELICAEALSENQLKELDYDIRKYIYLRIALKVETDRLSKKDEAIDITVYEHLGDLSTKVQWPVLKPKHTFILYYVLIIREVGALVHGSTLRLESKNGALKRKARQANTYKNIAVTILQSENETQAVNCSNGLFSEPELMVIKEAKALPGTNFMEYMRKKFPLSSHTFADSITYKGTYCSENYNPILIYTEGKKNFEVGVIRKFVVLKESNTQVQIVYEKTEIEPMTEFGLHSVLLTNEISHIDFKGLASFYPLYLFKLNSKKGTSELYLSLHTVLYLQ